MSRLGLERVRRDERGAVLMIVGLSLLVLLGMLVLTVDLGRSIAIKRQMVNGTDAAALAAAQQCALGEGSSSASSSASSVLAQNREGATVTTFTAPQCENPVDGQPKFVVVESTTPVDYYFAPIFGFDSGSVTARAVAQWGAIGETNPVPITVDQAQLLNNCEMPIEANKPPPGEVDCDLTYPKDALTEPRWGVLDLSQWGIEDAAPCSVDASTLAEIIESGGWPAGPLPEDNYDCLDNGLSFSVWETMEGRVLTFPVIDVDLSTGTVKPNNPPLGGTPCTGAEITSLREQGFDCQIDTAFVIGFISLLVNDVVNNGSTVDVDTTYLGPTTGNGVPCPPDRDCTDFGLSAIRLVE